MTLGVAGSDFGAAHPLWTFLTALSAINDEVERARLTATGLPSLLQCNVSGAALLDEAETRWRLVLQMEGEQLDPADTERILNELAPLFQEVLQRTTLYVATTNQEPGHGMIPPAIEAFQIQLLALAPVVTLHHRMGVLFFGRRGSKALSREDELTLSMLAEHLAIGIENLRLSQTLQNRSRDLEEIAARYQSLYNDTPVMMHSIDSDGRLIDVNDHWLTVLGYERTEVLSRPSTDFLTEESRRRAIDVTLPEFSKTGVAKDVEYQFVKKNGEIIDVLLSATAEFDERGTMVRSLAFIVDVTDHRNAEQELARSEERFRKIFEHSNDAVFVIDPARDTIVNVNSMACDMLGYTRDELLALPVSAIHPDEMPALLAFADSVFREGHGSTNELSCLTKTGERLPTEMSASIVEFDRETHMIALVRDISDRKRAEQAAAERTAELEAFTYSVSHDLRAPLRAIAGFSRILMEDHSEKLDEECDRLLAIIRSSAHNMSQLIDDLLALAHLGRQEMSPTQLDMRGLAAEVFEELQVAAPNPNIQFVLGNVPPARGDRVLVRQLFTNLLSNAIKFSSMAEPASIEVGHRTDLARQAYYVKDNGVGFDMRYVDKLFGLFQRLHTTDEFEGTGVGLAIVYRIVQRHGGSVWAEGEVGGGATIFFSL